MFYLVIVVKLVKRQSMGRPRKPIQQRSNGIYVVQLWINGKRHVRSLETRDPEKAAVRAAQAMKALKEGATQIVTDKWAADTPVILGDPENDSSQVVEWSDIAPDDEILPPHVTNWWDLVRESESVFKRKKKKARSASWHKSTRIAINQCPFTLQQASPTAIRDWI